MALVDRFETSPKSALQTMRDYTGIRVKYIAPSQDYKNNMITLIQALRKHDNNPSKDNVNAVMRALKSLNMSGLRLKEDPNCLIFFPNDIATAGDGVTLLWRVGKVKVNGEPNTHKNPVNNAFISNEHMKKDFADKMGIAMFLKANLKGMLCNGVAFGCSPRPSPCQGASVKESDVSHSDTPLYFTAIKELVKQYPKAPVSNLHGMQGFYDKPDGTKGRLLRRAIFVNNFNDQFLTNGQVSWPLLFAIALAQQDIPPYTVAFGSRLPGSIVDKDGNKVRLANPEGNSYFIQFNGNNNISNVPGHVANGGGCKYRGTQLDMSMHMEFGPEYREEGALQDKVVAAFNQALYWYTKYKPEVHNVWTLPSEIKENMRKYPEYFDSMLRATNQQGVASANTAPILFRNFGNNGSHETRVSNIRRMRH